MMKNLFYTMLLTTAIAMPVAGAWAQSDMNSTTGMNADTSMSGTDTDMSGSADTGITANTGPGGMAATTSVADSTFMRGEILDTTTLTQLQHALQARGYNPGRVDGVWGPRTADALRRFHMDNGASTMANGMLNSSTLTQLGIDSNSTARMNSPVGTTNPGVTNNTIEPSAGVNTGTSMDSTIGGSSTMDNGISGSSTMDMGVGGSSTMDMNDTTGTTGSSTNNSTSGSISGSTGSGSAGNP